MLPRLAQVVAALAAAAQAGAVPAGGGAQDCGAAARLPGSGTASDLHAALDALAAAASPGAEATCGEVGPALRRVIDGAIAIGEYGSAVRACGVLRQARLATPPDLLACARPHAIRGEIAEARAFLDEYVGSAGDAQPQALLDASAVMEGAARFGPAADLVAAASAAAPSDPAIAVRLVRSLLQAGRPGEAASAADAAAKRAGQGASRVLRESCWLLLRHKEGNRARPLAATLTGARPLAIEDLDAVAAVAEAVDDPEMARKAATQFAEQGQGGAAVLREAAGTLERHAHVAVAGQFLAAAIARGGASADADDRLRLGRLELLAGKPDDAAAAFGGYLRVRSAPEAHVRVADEWLKARMPERAVDALKAAISLGVESPDLVLALGRALSETGDGSAESAAYAAAAARSRDPADLWQRIGEGLMARSRPDGAQAAFRAAIQAAGNAKQRGLALAGVAEALLAADRRSRDAAEQSLLAALDAAGDDPAVLDRVNRIAERLGASGSLSLAVLERNVRRDPARTDLWARLGKAYAGGRRRADAVHAYAHMIRSAADRKAALGEALDALLKARWHGEALRLLRDEGGGEPPTPALAEAAGQACVAVGDRKCASRYVGAFLAGPTLLDYDYLALAAVLMDTGLWGLAGNAIEAARRGGAKGKDWEAEISAARLDLLRGRLDAADARFQRAWDLAPQRRPTALRIAREYQQAMRLARAAEWYARAVGDGDASFKAQVFPAWAEVLWRLQRPADIRAALAGLDGASWRNPTQLRAAVTQLVSAGLAAEAATLLEKGVGAAPARERGDLSAMLVGLLLGLKGPEPAMQVATARCEGPPGGGADTECLAVAARLAGALRPDLAAKVLAHRVAATAGAAVHAQHSVLLFRLGRHDQAMEAAARAVDLAATPADVIGTIGSVLADARAWDDWTSLIQRMAARSQFAGEPDLLFEAGRAHLAAGNVGGAMLGFHAYCGVSRGGEVRAYRELAGAGAREDAARLLDGAPPAALAAADPSDLREVMSDLLTYGRKDLAAVIVERYRRGNEKRAAADQVIAKVMEDLGRHADAVAAFRAAGPARLAGPDRAVFVRALWAAGARAEALEVALAGVRGPDQQNDERPAEPWVQELVDFFVSEDAIGESLALLERIDREFGLPAAARLLSARLLVRSGKPEAAVAGRLAFAAAVTELPALPPEGFEHVQIEAAAGTLDALRAALAGAGDGRAAAAARLAAACLAGDAGAAELEALTGPAAAPDPDGLRVAAEVLFRCGRWTAARDVANAALRESGAGDDPTSTAIVAHVAARMAGGGAGTAGIEAILRDLTDDRVRQLVWTVTLRLAAGDYKGAASAAHEAAQAAPADANAGFVAVETALWAGDDALRGTVEREAWERADDRGAALSRLSDLYRRDLRDDLAVPHARALAGAFPGDRAQAWRVFELSVRAGLWPEAEAAARAYVDLVRDRRSAAADVVSLASGHLSHRLVSAWLETVLDGPPSNAAARTGVQAAILGFRSGRVEQGLAVLKRAAAAAADPTEVVSLAAQAALVDPDVPVSAISAASGAASGGLREPGTLPYAVAARCSAAVTDAGSAKACADQVRDAGLMPGSVLMAAAYRTLAERRYEAASGLIAELLGVEAGRGVRLHVAGRVMSYLGCGTGADPSVRRRMAEIALSLVEPPAPVVPEASSTPLRAHLVEMARGLPAATKLYDAEIRRAPAEAAVRNNVAYLLSLCGGEAGRAVREARTAGTLLARSNGFYIETEAWAEFIAGKAAAALALQEKARRLWNLEQGGGMAESLHHMGRMLEAAGRTAEAAEVYRRAATLEPGEWDGRAALRRWRELSVQ
ncbi:MAG: hypothetical protein FJ087_13695 [Deltaproteobacteria bacterium]|nr:hypothetical protein [Deltaproteobacteria bacterium]